MEDLVVRKDPPMPKNRKPPHSNGKCKACGSPYDITEGPKIEHQSTERIVSQYPNDLQKIVRQDPAIQAAIAMASDDLAVRQEIKQEYIIEKLRFVADVDPLDVWTSDIPPRVRNMSEIPPHVRQAIQSFEVGLDGQVKVKFYSKLQALELLGKHLGIFKERIELALSYEKLVEGSFNVVENKVAGNETGDTGENKSDRNFSGVRSTDSDSAPSDLERVRQDPSTS